MHDMSDEPQPQQPNPGWAPREPQAHADGDPGTPRTQAAGKPKRTGWRRIIPTWRMTLGGFVIVVLLLVGGFFLGYSLVQIPRPTRSPPSRPTSTSTRTAP